MSSISIEGPPVVTAATKASIDRRVAVAPMMDWTDRHCRYFMRLISPHALLYTEMITSAAVVRGDAERHLKFHPSERPLALQLGGADPDEMARAAEIAADFGYDEINMNVGCPSDRVQSGRFGACLMIEPRRVSACLQAMREAVDIPVTVKSRIGVDDHDDYGFLADFVRTVAEAGCEIFIIHARKAILRGLSPKQNREVPPLNYRRVQRIKEDFPALTIVLNGGLRTLSDAREQLDRVDGVMIGREAYQNPWFLADVEREILAGTPAGSREEVVRGMLPYIEETCAQGTRLHSVTRHMLGLFAGRPGARAWRRHLSEQAVRSGADGGVVMDALERMRVTSAA